MNEFGEIVGRLYDQELAVQKNILRTQVIQRLAEAKKEKLQNFVIAVQEFTKPQVLEGLVEEKFFCKFSDLSEKKKLVFSITCLLFKKVSVQDVARQMHVTEGHVEKWHYIYLSKGFTGVKDALNQQWSRNKKAA